MLTKAEGQRYLNNCPDCFNVRKTQVIRIQGNCRQYSCWEYFFQELERMFDGVEVLTWILYSANDRIESNTELYGGDCIQDGRDPFALPRYRVSPVTVRMDEFFQVKE